MDHHENTQVKLTDTTSETVYEHRFLNEHHLVVIESRKKTINDNHCAIPAQWPKACFAFLEARCP